MLGPFGHDVPARWVRRSTSALRQPRPVSCGLLVSQMTNADRLDVRSFQDW